LCRLAHRAVHRAVDDRPGISLSANCRRQQGYPLLAAGLLWFSGTWLPAIQPVAPSRSDHNHTWCSVRNPRRAVATCVKFREFSLTAAYPFWTIVLIPLHKEGAMMGKLMGGNLGQPDLSEDLLRGARQIGEYIYGNHHHCHRRKIYHLVQTSRLPVFRLGSVLCARRSVLMRWIESQEGRFARETMRRPASLPPVSPAVTSSGHRNLSDHPSRCFDRRKLPTFR
jgi:hypothetical protein